MQNEFMKQKYIDLRNKMYIIKSELSDLNIIYDELSGILKDGIMVNDEFVDSEMFYLLKKNNNDIISEISFTLLPMIESNI